MASTEQKTTTAPKKEAAAKDKTAASSEAPKAASTTASEAAPANYSRGEGQKVVTQAYRDNWHAIFGEKPKKAKAKTFTARKKSKRG